MEKPTDFKICSECFQVFDGESIKNQKPCKCSSGQEGALINWGYYFMLNSSFPLLPKVGETYSLPESLMVPKTVLMSMLTFTSDELEDFYESWDSSN